MAGPTREREHQSCKHFCIEKELQHESSLHYRNKLNLPNALVLFPTIEQAL